MMEAVHTYMISIYGRSWDFFYYFIKIFALLSLLDWLFLFRSNNDKGCVENKIKRIIYDDISV